MSTNGPTSAERDGGRRLLRRMLLAVLLAAAGAGAYSNSFQGAFLFDDVYHIVENERIRQWWPPWHLLAVERPVVELSLAVNYALGGLNPWGYHAYNLVVHVLASLTLFGVVRRTMVLNAECGMGNAEGADRHEGTKARRNEVVIHSTFDIRHSTLAFAVALLWALHPLQTQSVTYVIQRGESLMGLFYLLTLYCAIRGAHSPCWPCWYGTAIIACALGMASKAVMVTAPIMVFVYDHVFLRPKGVSKTGDDGHRHGGASLGHATPSRGLKPAARWGLYLGLAATWGVLWACDVTREVLDPGAERSHVGFGYRGITPLEYAATQPGVILHYLRLAFRPVGLCLDYDWTIASTPDVIILPTVIIAGLLIVTVYGLLRRSWLGFAGAWFFLILAPTSSFIPIKDLAFEHRMYLPLAAVIAVSVFGGLVLLNGFFQRLALDGKVGGVIQGSVVVAVAMLLTYGTYQRNGDYRSDLAMWADVVAKRPYNARAQVALGNALLSRNRVEEAIAAYREAVALRPDFADGYCALGMGLARKDVLNEAVVSYRESLRLDPNHAKAHYNLGNALSRQERTDDAIRSFRESLRIEPRFADAHCNLGNALAAQGQLDEAMAEYREALGINPDLANAHKNLGDVLVELGRVDEGIAEFREAIRIQPDYANAHANLAETLLDRGEYAEAARHAQEALRLDPKHPIAKEVLNGASERSKNPTPGGG